MIDSSNIQRVGYPIPVPIVGLVLIYKAMGNIEVWSKLFTPDFLFAKYQEDPQYLANRNRSNNGHWNRVSHCPLSVSERVLGLGPNVII